MEISLPITALHWSTLQEHSELIIPYCIWSSDSHAWEIQTVGPIGNSDQDIKTPHFTESNIKFSLKHISLNVTIVSFLLKYTPNKMKMRALSKSHKWIAHLYLSSSDDFFYAHSLLKNLMTIPLQVAL